jgi:hypothetical protein
VRIPLGLVVLLAVVAGVFLLDRAPGHRQARNTLGSAGAHPNRHAAAVLQNVPNAGISAVVLVPGDPRALDVVVEQSKESGACSLVLPKAMIVSQDNGIVRLRASGESYVPLSKSAASIGGVPDVLVMCAVRGYLGIRVHLDRPLGHRRVVDDGGSVVVPLDPADDPQPAYLPPGFAALSSHRIDVAAGHLTAERRYVRVGEVLELQAGQASSLVHPALRVTGSARVGGHRAVLAADAGTRCLSWPEDSGLLRELCDYPGSGTAMRLVTLLRMARSVHP